jgi:hypothetical protein
LAGLSGGGDRVEGAISNLFAADFRRCALMKSKGFYRKGTQRAGNPRDRKNQDLLPQPRPFTTKDTKKHKGEDQSRLDRVIAGIAVIGKAKPFCRRFTRMSADQRQTPFTTESQRNTEEIQTEETGGATRLENRAKTKGPSGLLAPLITACARLTAVGDDDSSGQTVRPAGTGSRSGPCCTGAWADLGLGEAGGGS